MAGYYTDLAGEQSRLGAAGYAVLDGERAHILAVAGQAARQGAGGAALRLVWAGDDYLRLQGYPTERRTALETGLAAARSLEDRGQEARCIEYLGDVHQRLDEYEAARARYEEARPIFAGAGDRLGEANCIKALGDVHLGLAEYEAARTRYEEARPIYAGIGDRYSLAATLVYLGLAYKGLAQPGPARQHLAEAIALYEAINSPWADWARKHLAGIDDESPR